MPRRLERSPGGRCGRRTAHNVAGLEATGCARGGTRELTRSATSSISAFRGCQDCAGPGRLRRSRRKAGQADRELSFLSRTYFSRGRLRPYSSCLQENAVLVGKVSPRSGAVRCDEFWPAVLVPSGPAWLDGSSRGAGWGQNQSVVSLSAAKGAAPLESCHTIRRILRFCLQVQDRVPVFAADMDIYAAVDIRAVLSRERLGAHKTGSPAITRHPDAY